MGATDLSECLSGYLSVYLPGKRNMSENTIRSYCDTFRLFLLYCRDVEGRKIERLRFKDIDLRLIEKFLDWLEEERHCSISTRNQRLAALRSFFRYAQAELPEYMSLCQKIAAVPPKKTPPPEIGYLSIDIIRNILRQADAQTAKGRRDLVLLSVLYDTGARVGELVGLSAKDVRLELPAQIKLFGKGRKTRWVPLTERTVSLLKDYFAENGLESIADGERPLFVNKFGSRLTRAGVSYILRKYFNRAKTTVAWMPDSVSPHVLRHSKAVHLLQAGVNLIYIRDLLGHVDVSTTQVYARADVEMKRAALQNIEDSPVPCEIPVWEKDADLMEWLSAFGKNKKKQV